MKEKCGFVFFLVLLLVGMNGVFASAGEVNFDDKVPTVDEVVSALKPDDAQKMKLRGINYKPEPKMLSITLQFEKNSYELTEQTKSSLAALGKALNSDNLKNLSFILEGHADAAGSDEFNRTLSQKRADAVKAYLVNVQKVDPVKLKTVGKGEQEPLDSADPLSMKNRRVRIVTSQ